MFSELLLGTLAWNLCRVPNLHYRNFLFRCTRNSDSHYLLTSGYLVWWLRDNKYIRCWKSTRMRVFLCYGSKLWSPGSDINLLGSIKVLEFRKVLECLSFDRSAWIPESAWVLQFLTCLLRVLQCDPESLVPSLWLVLCCGSGTFKSGTIINFHRLGLIPVESLFLCVAFHHLNQVLASCPGSFHQ